MTNTSRFRISELSREKTSLELPVALSKALYQKIDALLDETGNRTTRPELLAALIFDALRYDTDRLENVIRSYRMARVADLDSFKVRETGIRRIRPGRPPMVARSPTSSEGNA